MLDFYNTPQFRFYDRKLAYSFIKKCAKKIELSQTLGNVAYFDVNRAYDILQKEKKEVQDFFEKVIKYQAYLIGNYSKTQFEPHECAQYMSEKACGYSWHHPITSSLFFVKQDPFSSGAHFQYIIRNMEDFDDNCFNSKSLDDRGDIAMSRKIFYKDL